MSAESLQGNKRCLFVKKTHGCTTWETRGFFFVKPCFTWSYH